MPPEVTVGDPVLWYEAGEPNGNCYPAVVAALGSGTALNLLVMSPDLHNFQIRDGAKWIGDPTIREDERQTAGAWEHHPRTKELADLRRRLAALEDAVSRPATTVANAAKK